MIKTYTLTFLTALLFLTFSNNTIAQFYGIQLNTEESLNGYTLIEKPLDGTWLIDNCGDVVNVWPSVGSSEFHPKLLPNGNLLYQTSSTVFELDWNSNIINSVSIPFGNLQLVYEVIKLPTDNYLCLGRRSMTFDDFVDLGFDMGGVNSPSRIDVVVELDYNTGEIVWEWNLGDHVLQERSSNLNNFGIIADHPELIDMDALATYDWTFSESFMINGMDYNPELDQIALSVRKMNEIMIIDHSTTTAEAAGHSGGNSGKGGDFIYRWGNPQNYGQGDESDHELYFQHNPKWITHGPHAGKLTCYNNGLNRPNFEFYSEVPIINTPVDANGNYTLEAGSAYAPEEPDFIWSQPATGTLFFSGYTSGAELLTNGNIFITEGVNGRLLEVNPDGDVVWQYNVPFVSYLFRSERYPANHPAFDGKDLTPSGVVNGSDSVYDCELFVDSTDTNIAEIAAQSFTIDYLSNRDINVINNTKNDFTFILFDGNGKKQHFGESQQGQHLLSLNNLPSGFYVLSVIDKTTGKRLSEKMILR
ncbi:MAG: aryl-sulfate sulfotransferase [Saprospiraceae bacterium]